MTTTLKRLYAYIIYKLFLNATCDINDVVEKTYKIKRFNLKSGIINAYLFEFVSRNKWYRLNNKCRCRLCR